MVCAVASPIADDAENWRRKAAPRRPGHRRNGGRSAIALSTFATIRHSCVMDNEPYTSGA